jgi:hypothetical protein
LLLLLVLPKIKNPPKRLLCLNSKIELKLIQIKKMARPTSQPLNHVLCSHPGESAGAGRVGLAGAKIQSFIFYKRFVVKK